MRTLLLTGLLLASAGTACRGGAPAAPGASETLAYDLVERVFVAQHEAARRSVLFGTPAAEPFAAGGFQRGDWTPAGSPSAWLRRRAEIALPGVDPDARTLVLDLEPAPGAQPQALRLFLRGIPVARVALTPGRRGYRFDLPASPAGQEPALRLFFDRSGARAQGRNGPAARLYSLTLARADDPALARLSTDDPAPLEVTRAANVGRVGLLGSGALAFALHLPGESRLRFVPFVAAGGSGARLAVRFEREGLPARELWSARLTAGQRGREVVLALPAGQAMLARLWLDVQAETPVGARAGFEGLHVMHLGPRAADPFATAVPAPAEARADALRARLRDANVLLVILDAARARSVSAYGYTRPTTPHLDRLAREGVLFEQAYTPAVFTLSAMASVWTSRRPLEHHAGVAHDAPLPTDLPTLAERLSAHGIATAGLIANSMAGPAFGLARGFAQFEEVHLEHGAEAPALTRRVQSWLRSRDPARRFFLYVHYREPHFPYDPPAPYATAFGPDAPLGRRAKRDPAWYGAVNDGEHALTDAERAHLVRLYDGNLASVDAQIGSLRETLAQTGLLEHTLVMVAADHGEALHEHGFIGHNQQVFEESTQIPLVLRWPQGAAPNGVRIATLVDLLDIAPTVADVFGLRGRDGAVDAFQGRSLLDLASGAERQALSFATSTGEWQAFGLRHEHFKYLRNVRHGVERLFDLRSDPAERQDVLAAHAVRAAFYRQGLEFALLRAARVARTPGAPARLSPQQLENLRALGYVQ